MIDWNCECACCKHHGRTIGELAGKRLEDIERANKSLDLADKAVTDRDRWRAIARQLFRQAIFTSPEARAKIIEACPGIEKETQSE